MEYKEAKDYQNRIRGEFHDFKIMESFLEGAPQSILQLTIILQEQTLKQVEISTWISIGMSFFTFSLGAAGIYTECPTKVQLKIKNISKSKIFNMKIKVNFSRHSNKNMQLGRIYY